MMQFEIIRDAITTLLENSASGQFQVIDYQKQSKDAENLKGNNRLVQVYYTRGSFPKRGGTVNGIKDHNMTFQIEMSVSAVATGDIAVLDNPSATAGQLQTALANITYATQGANDSLDELFRLVYQIIMDARNIDLGLSVGNVSDRWIDDMNKDDPIRRGSLVVITGNALLTCRGVEEVTGATPTTGEAIDTEVKIQDDSGYNTGTLNDPTS